MVAIRLVAKSILYAVQFGRDRGSQRHAFNAIIRFSLDKCVFALAAAVPQRPRILHDHDLILNDAGRLHCCDNRFAYRTGFFRQ